MGTQSGIFCGKILRTMKIRTISKSKKGVALDRMCTVPGLYEIGFGVFPGSQALPSKSKISTMSDFAEQPRCFFSKKFGGFLTTIHLL